jgi:Domain of unknown function (DUF4349)
MPHKPTIFLFVVFVVALIATGCANAERPALEAPEGAPAPAADEAGRALTDLDASFSEVAVQNAAQPQLQDRLIIRDGNLDLVVLDTEEALDQITTLAEEMEGWVVTTNIYQVNEAKTGSITIRVPADRFDEAVDRLKAMAVEDRGFSSNAQDVTEEYVDLSARLENLEATAARVRSFLDETRNVEEALAVNQELSRLEGEIESLKGRLQYLSQSAAFSSLTISLTPDVLAQPIEIGGWRPEGVAREAVEALIAALQGVGDVLIWALIFCLPLGLLIGIPVLLFGRGGLRRWRARRQAPADAEQAAGETEAVDD